MISQSRYGKLIVFEGPDGVGKSTLSAALAEKLRELNIPCEHLAFPGREDGTIGALVYDLHHSAAKFGLRRLTSASLQALHIAAHLDVIEQRVLPALSEGRWVILDRFWWSTWVYGTATGVPSRTLDAMMGVERVQWNGVKPAMVFAIERVGDLPLDESADRLREGYRALAEKEQGRYPVRVIRNQASVDEALVDVLENLGAVSPELNKTIYPAGDDRPTQEQRSITAPVEAQSSFVTLTPARPTVVYDTLWRFAAERQAVFFRKLEGATSPWTADPIIARHKFTNAYRASDRVSQFLIRHVLYEGDQATEEIFFRTILFKLFNRIGTWQLLEERLGTICFREYSFTRYDRVLTEALESGTRIYSAAYIMPSGTTVFGESRKHRNHLRLLERMMEDGVPHRIADAASMKLAFKILHSYPMLGDFLAYQYIVDLNYSNLTNFSEMDFVMPGPGSVDGIQKCFSDLGGLNATDIIRLVTERQEQEFERVGVNFRTLWGRRLQLIDCQNLFCELSKYARLKHPEFGGASGRLRIKQLYHPNRASLEFWYPPKWGINHLIPSSGPMA